MFHQDSAGSGTAAQAHYQVTAVLVVRHPPADRGRTAQVTADGVLIGRGETSGLILTDPSASRRHAAIRMRDGEYVIEDLGSLNGTFLNGARVTARRTLRNGDELRFGRTVVEFSQAGDGQSAGTVGPPHGSWRPNAQTQPINRGGPSTGRHPDHSLRSDLRAAPSFSSAALLLAVLGSVVGTVLLSFLEGDVLQGPWWRLVGAAVGPVISTAFTTKQAGEKGRIRAAVIVLLSSTALLITVTGTSLTEYARGAPVISRQDEGSSTFPVPGLSERMTETGQGGTGGTGGSGGTGGTPAISVQPDGVECESALVGQQVDCGEVTITSTGDKPLTVIGVDREGSHIDDFMVDHECVNVVLDQLQSCTVRVFFAPTDSAEREAVLVIRHDAPDELASVTLRGTAHTEVEQAES